MGLVFQSRAFVYLREDDTLETDYENYHCDWYSTGSNGQFRHFCADAKSHSFTAAYQVHELVSKLSNSLGFFSLTADPWDAPENHDRGYLLLDGFREINTRTLADPKATVESLFAHFAYCREIYYSIDDTQSFLSRFDSYQPNSEESRPIAGWFFIRRRVPNLEPALKYFQTQKSLALGSGGLGHDDQYLFFGDVGQLDSTFASLASMSSEFHTGAGLFFVIHPQGFEQIAVFHGGLYQLGILKPSELAFHNDVQMNTGRAGYDRR